MDSKPEGIGRGRAGRAAIIMAQLQTETRRPCQIPLENQASASSSSVGTAEIKPIGRGALLQAVLEQERQKQIASQTLPETLRVAGRGIPQQIASEATSETLRVLGRGIPQKIASEATSVTLPVLGRGIPQQISSETVPVSGRGLSLAKKLTTGGGAPLLGRGRAFMQEILSQGTPDVSSSVSLPSMGRGKSPIVVSPTSSSIPSQITSPDKSTLTTPSVTPPTFKFEELKIGQYRSNIGKPLDLEVNYIRLLVSPDKGIYEYHVGFNPSIESKQMKFVLIKQPNVKEIIGDVRTFDGSKLYLPKVLDHSPTIIPVSLPTDGSSVTISIKFIRQSQHRDLIHLYNVLFRKVMNVLKMTQIGRNYFDPKGGIPVPQHKLEIWPGYVTAVQEYEGGIMLNCDASFRMLRTVTARDVMREVALGKSDHKSIISKILIDCIVLTRYNNKTYRIDDIAWEMTPQSTFLSHTGNQITFIDYYKKSYDIKIQDLNQPLLINRPKEKQGRESDKAKFICLIPELCFMTGLTDELKNDFRVKKDIAVHTRITPERRQGALKKFLDNVNKTPEALKIFENWNLKLDSKLLSLTGNNIAPVKISFQDKSACNPNADWGREATSYRLLSSINIDKWAIIFTKRDSSKVQEFIKMYHNVTPALGISVRNEMMIEIANDRTESYCDALKEVIRPDMQIVVIIFPSSREDRYNAVKKLCCLERPIPSQVILIKTISAFQKLRSVTQKVALQINCKLGGELWSVHIPLKNIMICGIDTYHDSSHNKQSVIALVASTNENITRWFSVTKSQKSRQELGDSLKLLFTAALRKYFQINHRLPEQIFIFRDGVGDGQMKHVAEHEVQQIESCFKNFDNYFPSLSVIVVQKRINTRMYVTAGNRLDNPPPGSILDHTVTRKNFFDFFLVSQHVRQGTVSPTHYVVVYDNSNIKPKQIQNLSYHMTHMYYNWPGTIRVPAPCQYAHKLAYLVGQNLHKDAHLDLADRLFYL